VIETEHDEERRTRDLRQANDFQGVLLAMAGHDLRQPLQSIMASYEWLARRLRTDSEQEYLRRGRVAITRLSEQLDQLVEALRLNEHSTRVQLVPVVLAPILVRLWDENHELASRKGITLHVRPPPAAIMSDAVLIEGILRNLIRNAIKYTPSGGRVLLGCRRRSGLVKIEVYDTGIGIPPEKLSQVFEAFQRLGSTQADGLGLGLFVVRRAVDLLGHAIEVRSAVDRGSCFSILIKAAGQARDWESAGVCVTGMQWRENAMVARPNPLPSSVGCKAAPVAANRSQGA
jgi:two-component system, OmpR family, phosphate regulon sensor histidine kinase PhoR